VIVSFSVIRWDVRNELKKGFASMLLTSSFITGICPWQNRSLSRSSLGTERKEARKSKLDKRCCRATNGVSCINQLDRCCEI